MEFTKYMYINVIYCNESVKWKTYHIYLRTTPRMQLIHTRYSTSLTRIIYTKISHFTSMIKKYFTVFMKIIFKLELRFPPVLKAVTNLRSKNVLTDIYSRTKLLKQYLKLFSFQCCNVRHSMNKCKDTCLPSKSWRLQQQDDGDSFSHFLQTKYFLSPLFVFYFGINNMSYILY